MPDYRGKRGIAQTLNGTVNDCGNCRSENGDRANNIAHRFNDGVADFNVPKPVRYERV